MGENKPYSIFMLGYTGCHNTGSDARILTIIDDIRHCFGDGACITVGSFYPENTARVIGERAGVKIERVPFVFPLKIFQLTTSHDITFLVEGSCFKQNWGSVLLYLFLWSAFCARLARRKCVAYAVDVGELSRVNGLLTRFICNRLDLLITRTEIARERLLKLGVTTRIHANTDTAFQFLREPSPPATPPRPVPEIAPGTVGLAPVEFHQWPLKTRLFGKKDECYNWPYYFTWDDERREKSKRLIDTYRRLVTHAIDRHDRNVVLIAMEALDTVICEQILDGLSEHYLSRIKVVSAKEYMPDQMAPMLRSLDCLVTSRYHACVLSMNRPVPQMAICHDERLESIYTEIGIGEDFLLNYRDPELCDKILPTFDRLIENHSTLTGILREKHESFFLPKCRQNRHDLRSWHHTLTPPESLPDS
ncbi:MAG TPA: polysaccharide pyruvyl transferase family protein [Pyrinomonadaceae bacterium]|nr:polysaccharide pyruvyl transferase family protein [Pyrinomonadaceae bacterium]